MTGVQTCALPILVYVLLIFFANLIFKNPQKGIYFFYGWIFFSIFTLSSYIIMSEIFFHFKQRSGLWHGEFSIAGFAGMALCLVAAVAAATSARCACLLENYWSDWSHPLVPTAVAGCLLAAAVAVAVAVAV